MKKYVFEDFKTEKEFIDWIDKQATEIKTLAYENRNEIYKRELEQEIERFRTARYAWAPLRNLRNLRKTDDYELIITIDNKGYHSFRMTFPISQEDLDAAFKYREDTLKELGKWGECPLDHAVYMTYKEKFQKEFPFVEYTLDGSYQAYSAYNGMRLRRISEVSTFHKKQLETNTVI